MLQVLGVGEIALYVENLERSTRFYTEVFGFNRITGDSRFAALRVTPQQVLLLFKKGGTREPVRTPGGDIPPHDGEGQLHLAFTIPLSDWALWETILSTRSVGIESVVDWGGGKRSIYFRDPDGHLVELATPGLWD